MSFTSFKNDFFFFVRTNFYETRIKIDKTQIICYVYFKANFLTYLLKNPNHNLSHCQQFQKFYANHRLFLLSKFYLRSLPSLTSS